MKRRALIAGATGLIGSQCLDFLIKDDRYQEIKVLARRNPGINHQKLKVILADFDRLNEYKNELAADDIYCCLGSTMKKAGTKENFYKVDFTYVTELARIARENGGKQFLVISSIGANANSKTFYLRVKGEMQEAVKRIGYPSLHIFTPSLLMGKRNEFRPLETISGAFYYVLSFLFMGRLRRYRGIQARNVALAMAKAAASEIPGIHIHEYVSIMALANK